MIYIILSLTLSCTLIFNTAHAQQKIKLYVKVSGEIDPSNDITIFGTQPPQPVKKKEVKTIDSLIDYNQINQIIKACDYKGVRVLNELGMVGWKLEYMIPIPKVEGAPFATPRLLFLLSKEFE